MPRGSPYSTARWQKPRRWVLARHGGVCQRSRAHAAPGPRQPSTSSSLEPYPYLFYEPSNLDGACRTCNYSGGREIRLQNRTDRQMLNHYEQVIEEQGDELDEFARRLEEYERRGAKPRVPCIA